ncbi:fructose-2,6-bisphosphatase [Stutzerimonas zhaodongensis]|uniref:fructose-2,6-bisphosphatase n=1 Tax=Stutzerimonas TaxID=2901164 RepID=UPI0038900301
MQIILVRHGRPDHGAASWSTPAGMKDWVERYNAASVVASERPESLRRLAGSSGAVVCSSLMRCVESRGHLNCACEHAPDPLFAEAHLPYPDWAYPLMPSRIWRVTFRTAWFFGFANHTEPVSESRQRASAAADKLVDLAQTHGSVLLMGHKIMNALIATQLRKRGWRGPAVPLLSGYWHPSRYHKS